MIPPAGPLLVHTPLSASAGPGGVARSQSATTTHRRNEGPLFEVRWYRAVVASPQGLPNACTGVIIASSSRGSVDCPRAPLEPSGHVTGGVAWGSPSRGYRARCRLVVSSIW